MTRKDDTELQDLDTIYTILSQHEWKVQNRMMTWLIERGKSDEQHRIADSANERADG